MNNPKYSPLPMLSERQAAARLGISVRTLQSWRMRGYGLRYVKIGKSVRYDPKEIEDFERRQTRQSTAEQPAT